MTDNRTCAWGGVVLWVVAGVGMLGCTRTPEEPGPRPEEEVREEEVAGEEPIPAVTPEVGRRLALVIGNESYSASPLVNPVNDARAVSVALAEVGFSVTRMEDATRLEMASAIARFAGHVNGDDVAFFYYAGHGIEADRENYLIPTDYTGRSEEAARLQGISASDVQEALASARVAMLVLDACRDNPYRGTRGGGGLAPMEARGTLIAYAAGAGEQALDESDVENGLFTAKFLDALEQPGLTATELFQRVRREVHAASDEQQWPAVYDDLLADFVFRAAVPSVAGNEEAPWSGDGLGAEARLEAETVFWRSIVESTEPADMEAYLRQFPSGVYAPLARNRLEALRRVAATPLGQRTTPVDAPGTERRPSPASAAETALGLDRASRRVIQQGLKAEGFDPGSVDGLFGRRTRSAVREWQAGRSVAVTGYLDAETVAALRGAAEEAALLEAERRAAEAAANPPPLVESSTGEPSRAPVATPRTGPRTIYLAGYRNGDVREFDARCSRVTTTRDRVGADFVLERTGGGVWSSESAVLSDGQGNRVRRYSAALQGNLFDDVCESL